MLATINRNEWLRGGGHMGGQFLTFSIFLSITTWVQLVKISSSWMLWPSRHPKEFIAKNSSRNPEQIIAGLFVSLCLAAFLVPRGGPKMAKKSCIWAANSPQLGFSLSKSAHIGCYGHLDIMNKIMQESQHVFVAPRIFYAIK